MIKKLVNILSKVFSEPLVLVEVYNLQLDLAPKKAED